MYHIASRLLDTMVSDSEPVDLLGCLSVLCCECRTEFCGSAKLGTEEVYWYDRS